METEKTLAKSEGTFTSKSFVEQIHSSRCNSEFQARLRKVLTTLNLSENNKLSLNIVLGTIKT